MKTHFTWPSLFCPAPARLPVLTCPVSGHAQSWQSSPGSAAPATQSKEDGAANQALWICGLPDLDVELLDEGRRGDPLHHGLAERLLQDLDARAQDEGVGALQQSHCHGGVVDSSLAFLIL